MGSNREILKNLIHRELKINLHFRGTNNIFVQFVNISEVKRDSTLEQEYVVVSQLANKTPTLFPD